MRAINPKRVMAIGLTKVLRAKSNEWKYNAKVRAIKDAEKKAQRKAEWESERIANGEEKFFGEGNAFKHFMFWAALIGINGLFWMMGGVNAVVWTGLLSLVPLLIYVCNLFEK